uniref:G_PROTEIN_RECEP_F1_2 domain-containing protein n=1 Tax=Steinernema glaseri TaxID=37863 RepID=A0A1I8AJ74_9BILA
MLVKKKRQRTLRLDWVFHTFFGYLSIPFSSAALLVTVLYVIVIVKAIKQRRVSRKCYVLLLNRAIGDIMACMSSLTLSGYVFLAKEVT